MPPTLALRRIFVRFAGKLGGGIAGFFTGSLVGGLAPSSGASQRVGDLPAGAS
jgi:hypothetical protein